MSAALLEGELIDGKYKILRGIGVGAWGNVYEGIHERIGRRVAIKVMHAEFAENTDMRERFEREARAATRIESEHVVHVFDMGFLVDGRPYIVMEFLNGEDLGKRLERETCLDPKVVAIIGVQSLRGLADAHAAGIFHRDIKPDNIVLVRSKHGHETVKIVDFGISKLATSGIPDKASTQTTQVLGSPVYMSPEQCRGAKNIDHRSDLFSLGVALFESVTGHLPFDGESFNALMFKIALEDAPDPRSFRPDLDPTFANILLKALSRTADRRYQSAEEFEAALVSWGERWGMGPEDWRRITSAGVRAEMTSYSDSSLSIRIGGHDSSLGATPVRPAFLEGSSSSSPPALVASPSPKQTRSTTARVLPFAALGAVGALAILASTWTLRDRGPSAPAARAAVARDRVVTIAPPPSVPAPRGKLEPDVQETMELGDASDITMSRPKPLALDAGAASMPRLERPRGVAVPRREVKESAEAPRTPSVLEGKSHSTASPPKTTTVIDGRVIETQF